MKIPNRASVVALSNRCTASRRICKTVCDRKCLPKPIELPRVFIVIDLIVEVNLLELEERLRG